MAVQPTLFYHGQVGTTSGYMTNSSVYGIIKNIVFCNTTASSATVTIGLSASGSTDAAAKRLFSAVSIPANTTVSFDCSVVLDPNYRMYGLQGTSGAITVSVSGVTLPL